MDKLDALRSFLEVAYTGSFTKASEQLNLTRAKVTRHVQDIENWLNLRLLHRTTRSVSLTAPGYDVIKYVERILADVTELERLACSYSQELTGEIRIATPIGLGQNLLYEAMDSFIALHPKVTVQLLMSDKNVQLVNERVDIALRFADTLDDGLIARRLMHIDRAVCCSPKYLNSHPEIREPEDLCCHSCLIHVDHDQWCFIKKQQRFHVPVRGRIHANDMGVLLHAALDHKGVACLPCDLANPYLESGQLVQVLKDAKMPDMCLWAVYLSRSHQRPAVRMFIDYLVEPEEPVFLIDLSRSLLNHSLAFKQPI